MNDSKNTLYWLLVLGLVVFAGYVVYSKYVQERQGVELEESVPSIVGMVIKIGDTEVEAEVADTEAEWEAGLSGRLSLPEGEGMLFAFPAPQKNYFWMKDMNFAIDMIWLDGDKEVIYVEHNATPDSYPKVFGPDVDSKYVLEVPAGFAIEHGIKVGDIATFTQ